MLTNRFCPHVMTAIDDVCSLQPFAGLTTVVLGGSGPGKAFATPWRVERGAFLDIGPHVFALLDHTIGPLAPYTWWGTRVASSRSTLVHSEGQVSQASLSITVPGATSPSKYRFWSAEGTYTVTSGAGPDESLTVVHQQDRVLLALASATATDISRIPLA